MREFLLIANRLTLRPFRADEFDLLYQLHSNPEVAKTTIDGIQSREQIKKYFDGFLAHQEKFGYSQWAVFEKDSGNFVGRAGFTNRALTDEIGVQTEIRFAFLPQFWGKGYALELTKNLLKFAFEDLKLDLVSASSRLDGEASHRALTRNGFRFIKNVVPSGYGTSDEIKYYLITRQEFLKINAN
jgi:ribosomal-protein-alanine N-acetyltransferase